MFIESYSMESYRLFLEWFLDTSMFRHFVHQRYTSINETISSCNYLPVEHKFYDLFDSRILKSENRSAATQQNMETIMKNCRIINKKAKTLKNRFKDFISHSTSNN